MAEEQYVNKEQFGEFVKRMEEGFFHVSERLQSLENSLGKRMDDLRNMVLVLYTPVAIALLGTAVKVIFFSK